MGTEGFIGTPRVLGRAARPDSGSEQTRKTPAFTLSFWIEPLRRARALVVGLAVVASTVACSDGVNSSEPPRSRVASVAVSPVSLTLPAGQTVRLQAILADASGNRLQERTAAPGLATASLSNEPVSVVGDAVGRTGSIVIWNTSDPERATVDARGVVTALSRGETTITATSEGRQGAAHVVVTEPDDGSLGVTPERVVLSVGESMQLQTYFQVDADSPSDLTWESDQPSRVTVSMEGLATAVAVGPAAITATAGRYSASVDLSVRPSTIVHGLDFPGNAGANTTLRFQFAPPPAAYPATYIWRTYPRQQQSYYTAFFWGNNGAFHGEKTYYGFHPYPDWETDYTHYWEIATPPGRDIVSAEHVVYDRWYTQVAVSRTAGDDTETEFYWDWPDPTRVVRHIGRVVDDPPNPVLVVGDAPWNPGNEVWNGVLRGFQFYESALTLDEIASEIASPGSVRSPWYLNLNPKPEDITDSSGRGNHPAWVGSERPALWTGMLTEAAVISTVVQSR
jgi:hypothetical protein